MFIFSPLTAVVMMLKFVLLVIEFAPVMVLILDGLQLTFPVLALQQGGAFHAIMIVNLHWICKSAQGSRTFKGEMRNLKYPPLDS